MGLSEPYLDLRESGEEIVIVGVTGAGATMDVILNLDPVSRHVTVKALRYDESWTASLEDLPCWPTPVYYLNHGGDVGRVRESKLLDRFEEKQAGNRRLPVILFFVFLLVLAATFWRI